MNEQANPIIYCQKISIIGKNNFLIQFSGSGKSFLPPPTQSDEIHMVNELWTDFSNRAREKVSNCVHMAVLITTFVSINLPRLHDKNRVLYHLCSRLSSKQIVCLVIHRKMQFIRGRLEGSCQVRKSNKNPEVYQKIFSSLLSPPATDIYWVTCSPDTPLRAYQLLLLYHRLKYWKANDKKLSVLVAQRMRSNVFNFQC